LQPQTHKLKYYRVHEEGLKRLKCECENKRAKYECGEELY